MIKGNKICENCIKLAKGYAKDAWCDNCPIADTSTPESTSTNTTESIYTNTHGGSNSDNGVRLELIPLEVLQWLGEVYHEGAQKYKPDNWKKVTSEEHFNHCLKHMLEARKQLNKEDVTHALCRATMWAYMILIGDDRLEANIPNT